MRTHGNSDCGDDLSSPIHVWWGFLPNGISGRALAVELSKGFGVKFDLYYSLCMVTLIGPLPFKCTQASG
eukprot:5038591-Amphidinium_carterae.1